MKNVKNVSCNIGEYDIVPYERIYERPRFWEEMSKYHSELLDILQEESSILEKWGLITPFFEDGKVCIKIPNFDFLIQLLETIYANKCEKMAEGEK